MHASVLIVSALVVLFAGSSLQEAQPEAAGGYLGGGGQGGFGGSQGGFGGNQGGLGGGRGFGGQGGDSRYGFNIVDEPERYGYEANYPGGQANFYLLGANRGPGQQRGGAHGGQGGY